MAYRPVEFAPIIYKSWGQIFKTLPVEQRSELLLAISLYPDYTPKDCPLWDYFRGELDKEYQQFLDRTQKAREAGKQRAVKASESQHQSASVSGRYPSLASDSHIPVPIPVPIPLPVSKKEDIRESEPDGFALANQEKKVSKEKSFEENDFPKIVEIYNNVTKGVFPQIKVMNADRVKKTRKWAHSLYKAHNCKDKEDFFLQTKKYFDDACRVPFLRGDNGNWKADYEYLISQKCLTKMLEGSYQPEPKQVKPSELHDWQKERDEYYAKQKAQSLGLSAVNNKPIQTNQHYEPLQHGEAIKAFLGAKQ